MLLVHAQLLQLRDRTALHNLLGIGIPLFAFILLTKERRTLDSVQTKEKYGFLYRGYKRSFYYWEIVIIYRKVILIFIAVFLKEAGNIV